MSLVATTGLVLALQLATPPADPRLEAVETQLGNDPAAALEVVERRLTEMGPRAKALGFDYLRGHLLLDLERPGEALQAFAEAMTSSPELEPWSRYRIAVEQARQNHPEVASGLLATLLGSSPPRALVSPAVDLLERSLRDGGDCRLLRGLDRLRLRPPQQRRLDLARAHCKERGDDTEAAMASLLKLLAQDTSDDVALAAARRLAPDLDLTHDDPQSLLLVGLSYYDHREFETAIRYLANALVRLPKSEGADERQIFDCRYALARSLFWLGRYRAAANAFGALARSTADTPRRAQVLYQRARCLELAGRGSWGEALEAFKSTFDTEPRGRWASAATIASLRLHYLLGQEGPALEALDRLLRSRNRGNAVRALLFMVSSDLVQGRTDRAGAWLAKAIQLDPEPGQETYYWRGRLLEAQGNLAGAAEAYLRVYGSDPFHPFGQAAGQRLRSAALRDSAQRLARRWAQSPEVPKLYAASRLLERPAATQARTKLATRLEGNPRALPFLQLEVRPAVDWPLWTAPLARPEDKLLALGLFEEGASAVLRNFPLTDPDLAFTGALVLAEAGATRRSLYVSEVLAKRIPGAVPHELLPRPYRQLLHPLSYSYLILKETQKRGVDPYLLAGIVREESRFDPEAFSAASARGLTQFIYPTARRLAGTIGVEDLAPADIHRPEVAIALGAAYLQELSARFEGATENVVAAYNAGEPQAELWRTYCQSDEREEYLTKVTFRETRGYLIKVLSSYAHYTDLYAPAP
ncbi:MAG: transglycosylase SLT domain-containing protein [Acidobacteriota bacterium]